MRILTLLMVSVIVLVSCQKEVSIDTINGGGGSGGSGTGSIIGTWKFIGTTASTESTVAVSDAGIDLKTITKSSYTTTGNTGTYTFTANKISFTGVGYTLNSIATSVIYLDGQLQDSIDFPFTYTLPPSNGEGTYKKVGADSLYFESGNISIPSSGSQPAQASGVRYKFSGDTLLLITKHTQSTTITDAGSTQKTDNKVDAVVKLLKQ